MKNSFSRRLSAARSSLERAAFSCVRLPWIMLLLLAGPACHGQASGLAETFEHANKLYEQAKYGEAASAYESLVGSGKVSAALYFNYANALFKSGQVGRAILNYRLAERLAPRDPDIRANLRFARESVNGASASTPWWKERLEFLTLNELATLAASALWIWFALLIAGQMRSSWRKILKGYTFTAGSVTALLVVWLGFSAYLRLGTELVVVIVPEAVVRYGPLEESQSFFTLRDGAELSVVASKNTWLQIQDAAGRLGWVRSDQVATVGSTTRVAKQSS